MKKHTLIALAAVLSLSLAFSACGNDKKKQEELQKQKDMVISGMDNPKYNAPQPIPLPKDQVVEVSKEIKAKHPTVIMTVGNRQTKKVEKFKVKVGGKAEVPGTPYTVEVHEYLPHWVLRSGKVTSLDDGPKDPAVRATIYEAGKDKPVFDGYIFEKHATPSFITDKFAIGMGELGEK